jgi:hypothetical protein
LTDEEIAVIVQADPRRRASDNLVLQAEDDRRDEGIGDQADEDDRQRQQKSHAIRQSRPSSRWADERVVAVSARFPSEIVAMRVYSSGSCEPQRGLIP